MTTAREVQRRETRERVYEAALAEYKRAGMAAADVRLIASATGVSRGTFFFHFPTKEHVLSELERREDARICRDLGRFAAAPRDLGAFLREMTRLVVGLERRLGTTLFREVLAHHFSASRATDVVWSDFGSIVLLVEAVERGRANGEVAIDADPVAGAVFFFLGLYGVLATAKGPKKQRAELLDKLVVSTLRSLDAR